MAPFTLRRHSFRGDHTIAMAGDLDMATAPLLVDLVTLVCHEGARSVRFDISALDFLDASGLRAILSGLRLCEQSDCATRMTQARPQVERLFRLTGTVDLLPVQSGTTLALVVPTGSGKRCGRPPGDARLRRPPVADALR